MIKLNDGKYIIGFDNGYQFGKSATTMFENGVYPLGKVEPSVREHSLKYDRRYEFEGIRYDVKISQVFVFPQCYSAIDQK
jgi:hypothetical protein